VWTRSYVKKIKVSDLIETDMTMYGIEAGYDYAINKDEATKIFIGLMGAYQEAGSVKTKQWNGMYAKGEGETPSAGVYAALTGESGWYLDITARKFWTKLNMTNYSAAGTELIFKPEREILAASIEAGKTLILGNKRQGYWILEPKGEITYMSASGGSTEVKNGTGELSYDKAKYITAKGSLLAGYEMKRKSGLKFKPYIEIGYLQELQGKGDIRYGGAIYKSDLGGGIIEGALGLDWQLTKDMYVYGQGSYEKGSKIEGYGANAGIRIGFGGKKKEEEKKGREEANLQTKEKIEKESEIEKEKLKAAEGEKGEREVYETAEKQPLLPARAAGERVQETSRSGVASKDPVSKSEIKTDNGEILSFGSIVNFDFNSIYVNPAARKRIYKAVSKIKKIKYKKIIVKGHTDIIESYEQNKKISILRAKAIAAEIEKAGIKKEEIETEGLAYDYPVDTNETKEGRAKNRRADIAVR
jgi:outer membrane protein OmpA-like peptidoglycan-associated protein